MLLCTSLSYSKEYHELLSPDRKVKLELFNKNDSVMFSFSYNGKAVFGKSPLGLEYNNYDLSVNSTFDFIGSKKHSEVWTPVCGKEKSVLDEYVEYVFMVRKNASVGLGYKIIFKLYNDGFGYRFSFDNASDIYINKEITRLNFQRNYTYWSYNHERHPLGPVERDKDYIRTIYTPTVLKFQEDEYLAIHEAAIEHFEPFTINATSTDFSMSFDFKYSGFNGTKETSWRTFIIADRVGGLVESNLIENMNEPCKIKDTSWIRPGKCVWDWRVNGYKSKSDSFEYSLNTISHKRFVDFAEKYNIQYMMVDANWYGDEFSKESNPSESIQGIEIPEFIEYARNKNIGVILYLNDIAAKRYGIEKILKQFAEWGAVGVKYGFMKGSEEEKARYTMEVIKLCAKYKLMVIFHDKMTPLNGENRTWPNLMSKEMVFATADTKYIMYPETPINSILVNMIAGPIDPAYGMFNLNEAHLRDKVRTILLGTVVGELAKFISVYSGWMVLPDAPEEYMRKPELLECIKNIPPCFDEFKVLDAELDEYLVVARKSGEDWFIASLTNREARTVEVDMSFLNAKAKYDAIIYSDDKDSHFIYNKESYAVRNVNAVNSDDKIKIRMAPGGGNVIYLKRIN